LVADDEVVEHVDVEELSGTTEPAGDAFVVVGWFGVPGGVVVRHHDRGGAVQ
jgi:hypothetical protein